MPIFDKDIVTLLEQTGRNDQYDTYLSEHIGNVQKGYEWIKTYLPELVSEINFIEEKAYYGELDEIIAAHDKSKYNNKPDAENYYDLTPEYDAYAEYFYGTKTDEVEEAFNRAWLSHIHSNPHHWQHWLLQNDDPKLGLKRLDIPYVFIVEMVCDWWSFSWKTGNLYEIFSWYETNKAGILLSDKSQKTLEHILAELKDKLDELGISDGKI